MGGRRRSSSTDSVHRQPFRFGSLRTHHRRSATNLSAFETCNTTETIMAPTNLSQGNSRANILIPDPRHHLSLWAALVVFLTLGQIAATAFVPRSLSLTLINDVIEFLLMLSALLVCLVNATASPRRTRLFWMLLAACWGETLVSTGVGVIFC